MHNDMEYLAHRYLDAKEFIIQAGYSWELDWQQRRSFESLTESDFLKETAWVILSSGFREKTLRRLFPKISDAFFNWESANRIIKVIENCRETALKVFGNKRKLEAICRLVQMVSEEGFKAIKKKIQRSGLEYLQKIPFIGPTTGLHLLKNLGFQIVKPDRHLVRIANSVGFKSPQELGEAIEEYVGDKLAEIDLVLWRFATLQQNYLSHFKTA